MKEYLYTEGTILNKLKILNQIRLKHGNGSMKGYEYSCCNCGYIGTVAESKIKAGCSCPACKKFPKVCVKDINSVWKTHPQFIRYFVNINDTYENTYCSNKKVLVKCQICGTIKSMIIGNLINQGFSCAKCSDGISYPHKFFFNILEQLKIEFCTEKSDFKWNNSKRRYDFYINSIDGIVEVNGIQHYEETSFKRTLLEEQENDKIKEKLAKENGIENYIIIDCRKSELEFIKNNILNSELNNLFDLSKIDWLKCEKSAYSNLVKMACDLWDNIKTTSDISKEMHLEKTTIRKYLKLGNAFGWCKYNPKEELRKSAVVTGKKNNKLIICYKDGVKIGNFNSITELSNLSEKLLGVKLNKGSISLVLRKIQSFYQGYFFEYME